MYIYYVACWGCCLSIRNHPHQHHLFPVNHYFLFFPKWASTTRQQAYNNAAVKLLINLWIFLSFCLFHVLCSVSILVFLLSWEWFFIWRTWYFQSDLYQILLVNCHHLRPKYLTGSFQLLSDCFQATADIV